MDKLDPIRDGASKDILEENIQKLKKIFPEVLTEGKIDFEKLKETLGEYVEDREERYNFTWNGKSEARRLAQTLSTGTLRPCPDESVNWEKTENLFIEGDNLEVLKLLQKSYHKKVKMIYIDPPYNTGSQFIYPDDFSDNIRNYLELTGQTDEEGRKLSVNPETSGRYHTDWLNMMYPRLKLAGNLLRDDGVIFISIDDNEVSNLRKMCDEIFGEDNFVGALVRKTKLTSNKGTHFSPSHEYILCYAKNIQFLEGFTDKRAQEEENYLKLFKYEDNQGKYNIVSLYMPALKGNRPSRYYISCPDGEKVIPPGDRFWRWSKETFKEKLKENRVVFKRTNTTPLISGSGKQARWNIYTKIYLHERQQIGLRPITFIDKWPNSIASKELIKMKIPFSYAKPWQLIGYLVEISGVGAGEIVLDFFAGSCSTAQAICEKNIKSALSKQIFICIQFPEIIATDEEAYKAGYKTIAEIGKERIRRVIKKIETEEKTKNRDNLFESKEQKDNKQLDLGFKVFKLDSSNIKPWEAGFDNLDESLFDAVENIKPERSESDVLYELLLKYGLDLTVPIKKRNIDDKAVYIIAAGALIVCLADNISLDVVEGIAKLKDELKPELMRVVFKDAGFEDDVVKTNTVQILRQHGIEDVKSI